MRGYETLPTRLAPVARSGPAPIASSRQAIPILPTHRVPKRRLQLRERM